MAVGIGCRVNRCADGELLAALVHYDSCPRAGSYGVQVTSVNVIAGDSLDEVRVEGGAEGFCLLVVDERIIEF